MIELKAETVIKLEVICENFKDVGSHFEGHMRVIPIIGGTFSGLISGVVLSGGADWSIQKNENLTHVFAKYMLQTDSGEFIAIENAGYLNSNENTQVIKTVTKFVISESSSYAWLNHGVYVGSLELGREPNTVIIQIFRLL